MQKGVTFCNREVFLCFCKYCFVLAFIGTPKVDTGYVYSSSYTSNEECLYIPCITVIQTGL
jgi:hypothetical protein